MAGCREGRKKHTESPEASVDCEHTVPSAHITPAKVTWPSSMPIGHSRILHPKGEEGEGKDLLNILTQLVTLAED